MIRIWRHWFVSIWKKTCLWKYTKMWTVVWKKNNLESREINSKLLFSKKKWMKMFCYQTKTFGFHGIINHWWPLIRSLIWPFRSFMYIRLSVCVCACVFIWYMIFTFLKKSLTTYRITFSDKRIHKDLTNIKNHYCSFFSECVKYVCFVRKKKMSVNKQNLKLKSFFFFLSFFHHSPLTLFLSLELNQFY